MRKVDPVKRDEKRREILAAAGRCFAKDGFQGAAVSEICKEAKVSPGHLYHYFDSKEAIITAMAQAGLQAARDNLDRLVEEPDAIRALLSELERACTRHPKGKQPLVLEMLASASRDPSIAKILQEHSRAMRAILSDFLRKGQDRGQIDPALDPETTATIFMTVIDGAKSLSVRDPKPDIKRSLEMLGLMMTRFLTPPAKRK